jgi:hypothetical protein
MKQGDVEKENSNWNIVIKYADDLLTDERTTLGDVNRSSLTFRVEEIDSGSTGISNQGQGSGSALQGENFVRWNKKTATKLPIKNVDFSFGMYQLSAIAVAVLLPLVGYHLYEYIANYSDANKIVNLVELYGLVAEMRNAHAIMRQALISTVLWNNTASILGKPSRETYLDFSKTMRDSIIFSFNGKRSLDYGTSFNSFFSSISGDYKVCDLLSKYGTGYSRCGQTSLASMDVNFIMFLRSLVSLTDDILITWQTENQNPNLPAELVKIPKFTNYLGITYNFSMVDDLYYVIAKPLAQELLTQLQQEVSQDTTGTTVV